MQAALTDDHRRVVVGTCGGYGRAVSVAAREAGAAATVVVPAGWADHGRWAAEAGADVLENPGGYEDAVTEARRLVVAGLGADGNVDGPFADAVLRGHAAVVDALEVSPAAAPTGIWVPVGNGTTIAAVGRRVEELGWDTRVYGVGSKRDNAAVASWPGPYRRLPADSVVATVHNEPLVNWHALHGPLALQALADTGGAMYDVDDSALVAAADVLAGYGIAASPAGAAGLAGLLAHTRCAGSGERHVVIATGRPVGEGPLS